MTVVADWQTAVVVVDAGDEVAAVVVVAELWELAGDLHT